jgi:hypothetical protein
LVIGENSQEPLQMNNPHKTFTKCIQCKHVATLNK